MSLYTVAKISTKYNSSSFKRIAMKVVLEFLLFFILFVGIVFVSSAPQLT